MMKGIAHIIANDLFNLEFICPHIDFLRLMEYYLRLLLLRQYIHALKNPPDDFRQVKPLKLNLIRSEFQLVQGQKILHHTVHFIRLIHDHIAVKFHALFITGNAFFQSFRISLDQCDRRLKLVRHISHKIISHLLQLLFSLNIFLQLIICAL